MYNGVTEICDLTVIFYDAAGKGETFSFHVVNFISSDEAVINFYVFSWVQQQIYPQVSRGKENKREISFSLKNDKLQLTLTTLKAPPKLFSLSGILLQTKIYLWICLLQMPRWSQNCRLVAVRLRQPVKLQEMRLQSPLLFLSYGSEGWPKNVFAKHHVIILSN